MHGVNLAALLFAKFLAALQQSQPQLGRASMLHVCQKEQACWGSVIEACS